MTIEDPRALLHRYNLRPRKSLGQNFLVDPSAPARIVQGAEVGPADTVLEVGAGLGTMTAELVARAARVIAVETDPNLIAVLNDELGEKQNLTIVHGDILALDPLALLAVEHTKAQPDAEPTRPLWGKWLPHYCVVANLPYYITAASIRHLLEARVRPSRIVITIQREVAKRIVASTGKMSLLSVGVQFYAKPKILFKLKRGAFYPAPKVESAVMRLDLYKDPLVEVEDIAGFFRVVRAGFSQRRKQLRNTLSSVLGLAATEVEDALLIVDVDPTRRAETLSLVEWGRVVNALAGCSGEEGE